MRILATRSGMDFNAAFSAALSIADWHKDIVAFEFNGFALEVAPGASNISVYAAYEELRAACRRERGSA